ncbi:MAG: FGGY family carbohydrate kinase [Anaerolineae bacterium]
MSLIGIDLGTSFIKAGVLDIDTLQLNHVQRVPFPNPLPGLPPLFREFDPGEVIAAVLNVLRGVALYADVCHGIVVCTQMHGVVFTTENGEPRSNLTTWQDQRVLMPHHSGIGSFFDVMKARLNREEIRQLGNELRPGLPIGLFFWMAEQKLLPDQHLIPAALSDFVIANLCNICPVTEATNAMAHGILNLDTMDWHYPVIGKLGFEQLRLPEIKPHGTVIGWLDLIGRRIPCFTPVGDYQCALLGALLQNEELSLNISTGSQVSLLKSKAEFGNFQTRPFFDGRFSNTITHIPAGRALNALVKLLSELAVSQGIDLVDPWAYITQAAEKVDLPTMRANLAFYSSAIGDEGAFTHLHEDELTVGHIFRAAFQSMAESYHSFAHRLSPDRAWRNLVFSVALSRR